MSTRRFLLWIVPIVVILLLTWVAFHVLPADTFRDNFLANFAATLLGVVIGIPVALALDASQTRQQERDRAAEEASQRRHRATQYLKMMQFSLNNCLTFLENVHKNLRPGGVIYANLDIEQLEATSALKYDLIDDLAIAGHLDVVRYDLRFLSRLLDLNLTMSYGAFRGAVGEASFRDEQRALVERVQTYIPDARKTIVDALDKIGTYLSKQATLKAKAPSAVTSRAA